MQSQFARLFLLPDAGEGPQIGEADLDGFHLHRALCSISFGAVRVCNLCLCIVEQADPVCDETAFAGLHSVHRATKRSLASAAIAMAHHEDLFDLQKLHGEF